MWNNFSINNSDVTRYVHIINQCILSCVMVKVSSTSSNKKRIFQKMGWLFTCENEAGSESRLLLYTNCTILQTEQF